MDFFGEGIRTFSSMNVFYSVIVGLVVGAAISYMTGVLHRSWQEARLGHRAEVIYGCCHQHHRRPCHGHDFHLRSRLAFRRSDLHLL